MQITTKVTPLHFFQIIAFDELRTDFKNPIDQSNPTRAVRSLSQRDQFSSVERDPVLCIHPAQRQLPLSCEQHGHRSRTLSHTHTYTETHTHTHTHTHKHTLQNIDSNKESRFLWIVSSCQFDPSFSQSHAEL